MPLLEIIKPWKQSFLFQCIRLPLFQTETAWVIDPWICMIYLNTNVCDVNLQNKLEEFKSFTLWLFTVVSCEKLSSARLSYFWFYFVNADATQRLTGIVHFHQSYIRWLLMRKIYAGTSMIWLFLSDCAVSDEYLDLLILTHLVISLLPVKRNESTNNHAYPSWYTAKQTSNHKW